MAKVIKMPKKAKKPKKAKIEAWFDGCCEPRNPGGTASFGAVAFVNGERVWDCSRIFHPEPGKENETSNNVAEYSGFLAILSWLLENGYTDANTTIYGDSKLVIEQMKGNWRIVKGFYKQFAYLAKTRLLLFKVRPDMVWIPRDENDIADELSKAELIKAGIEFRIQPLDGSAPKIKSTKKNRKLPWQEIHKINQRRKSMVSAKEREDWGRLETYD